MLKQKNMPIKVWGEAVNSIDLHQNHGGISTRDTNHITLSKSVN